MNELFIICGSLMVLLEAKPLFQPPEERLFAELTANCSITSQFRPRQSARTPMPMDISIAAHKFRGIDEPRQMLEATYAMTISWHHFCVRWDNISETSPFYGVDTLRIRVSETWKPILLFPSAFIDVNSINDLLNARRVEFRPDGSAVLSTVSTFQSTCDLK